jgi:hypothetical protein
VSKGVQYATSSIQNGGRGLAIILSVAVLLSTWFEKRNPMVLMAKITR